MAKFVLKHKKISKWISLFDFFGRLSQKNHLITINAK